MAYELPLLSLSNIVNGACMNDKTCFLSLLLLRKCPTGVRVTITSTVISLLQARASIRIISNHRDGGGPLLEATSARKDCSFNLSERVPILRC